jgi:tetratricopeptide (TPR) repeat protein
MMRPRLAPGLALAAGLAASLAASAETAKEAAALIDSARREDQERAAAIFEALAAKEPNNFDVRLGAAVALTQVMAIRTHGNLPLVDGLQDTDENRALWADLGQRALEHARAAEKLSPQSAPAAAALASSYMFYASSLGIIRSILPGAGGEYKAHAQRLAQLDPKFDDGLGASLLANFYLVAPWPVHDRNAALEQFELAAKIAPESVRNQYGLAVFWARDGDAARARTHFERVVAQPCSAHTERLMCDFMKSTARRELARLPAK